MPELKKIGGLKKLPSFGRLKLRRSIAGPGSDRRVGEIVDLVPEEERTLIRKLGGNSEAKRLAKRIIRYKGVYPTASYPELISWDWLDRQGIRFTFQAHLFGGRSVKGGLVPDFAVTRGGFVDIWQIQGEYWHSQLGSRVKDETAKLRYIGQYFEGKRIERVINIWESDVYTQRPAVFTYALNGVEIPR